MLSMILLILSIQHELNTPKSSTSLNIPRAGKTLIATKPLQNIGPQKILKTERCSEKQSKNEENFL